jgi:hypothetical protein
LRREFHDSLLRSRETVYLLYDQRDEKEIDSLYTIAEKKSSWQDYEVSMLDFEFLNPATRKGRLGRMILAEISK